MLVRDLSNQQRRETMEMTHEEMAVICGGSSLRYSLLPPGMPEHWYKVIDAQSRLAQQFEQLVW